MDGLVISYFKLYYGELDMVVILLGLKNVNKKLNIVLVIFLIDDRMMDVDLL